MRAPLPLLVLVVMAGISSGSHAQDDFPAQAGRYRIVPDRSQISFAVGNVGGGAIVGRFTRFQGEMRIDPAAVGRSSVEIVIVPDSVTTGQSRVDDFLKSDAIFDAAHEREIRFVSTKVTRTGDRTALIEGRLTARGKTRQERFVAELDLSEGRSIGFHVTGGILRSPYGMDAGTPVYSNRVDFDMKLSGVRS